MANSLLVLGLAIASLFLTYGGSVNGCGVNIHNNCPFQVTGCSQTETQNIVQYNLSGGGSAAVDLGGVCEWPHAVVYASVTGQCAVSGQPAAATDRNLSNLAGFAIGDSNDGQDYYNLSNVHAYSIGLAINPSNSGCDSISCIIANISGFCQAPNRLVTTQAPSNESYETCINTDGTNGIPTDLGTRPFRAACPSSYSYYNDSNDYYDDYYIYSDDYYNYYYIHNPVLFSCGTGTDYTVVFCPEYTNSTAFWPRWETIERPNFYVVTHAQKNSKTLVAILVPCGILASIVLAAIVFCAVACPLRKIRERAFELRQIQDALTKEHVKPRFFGYEELRAATNGFSRKNVLGKGGFGIVYKAELADGSVLAVKRLKTNATDRDISEFVKEIINISGIKHKHLIQLKGCCVWDKQRLLVYEYAENKSLAEALCSPDKPFVLSWQQRFKICLGIARGLAYLHEELQPKMIHRDIKPQNILLDKEYNAKIADFGLVRPSQVVNDRTSITITIGGTRGYIPPEYVTEGLVSEKLDVFSLGVVFFEIVAGRLWLDTTLSEEQAVLRNWAVSMFDRGKVLALVDKQLNGEYNEEEVLIVLHTALACCQIDSKRRPTIFQVVNWLMKNVDITTDFVKQLRGTNPQLHLEGILEEDRGEDGEIETFSLISSGATNSSEGSRIVHENSTFGPR